MLERDVKIERRRDEKGRAAGTASLRQRKVIVRSRPADVEAQPLQPRRAVQRQRLAEMVQSSGGPSPPPAIVPESFAKRVCAK